MSEDEERKGLFKSRKSELEGFSLMQSASFRSDLMRLQKEQPTLETRFFDAFSQRNPKTHRGTGSEVYLARAACSDGW